eukprot:147998-Amphidinium_carterae.1
MAGGTRWSLVTNLEIMDAAPGWQQAEPNCNIILLYIQHSASLKCVRVCACARVRVRVRACACVHVCVFPSEWSVRTSLGLCLRHACPLFTSQHLPLLVHQYFVVVHSSVAAQLQYVHL